MAPVTSMCVCLLCTHTRTRIRSTAFGFAAVSSEIALGEEEEEKRGECTLSPLKYALCVRPFEMIEKESSGFKIKSDIGRVEREERERNDGRKGGEEDKAGRNS